MKAQNLIGQNLSAIIRKKAEEHVDTSLIQV